MLEILKNPVTWVVIGSLLSALFGAIWWASSIHTKVNKNVDLSNVKTDVSDLKSDVSDLKTDVSNVKTDVSDLKTDVRDIRTDIRRLFDFLLQRGLTASSSPVALTELGQTVSNETGAKEWAVAQARELLSEIEHLSKEYEIYKFCDVYIRDKFKPDKELKSLIQEVAYAHGVSTTSVCDVFTIELRDQLLLLKPIDSKKQ